MMSCCEGWDINRSSETPIRYMPYDDDNVDVILLCAFLCSFCEDVAGELRKVNTSSIPLFISDGAGEKWERCLSHRVLMFSKGTLFLFIMLFSAIRLLSAAQISNLLRSSSWFSSRSGMGPTCYFFHKINSTKTLPNCYQISSSWRQHVLLILPNITRPYQPNELTTLSSNTFCVTWRRIGEVCTVRKKLINTGDKSGSTSTSKQCRLIRFKLKVLCSRRSN